MTDEPGSLSWIKEQVSQKIVESASSKSSNGSAGVILAVAALASTSLAALRLPWVETFRSAMPMVGVRDLR